MRTPRCSGTARKAKGRLVDEPDLIFNTTVLRSEDVTSACRELGPRLARAALHAAGHAVGLHRPGAQQ